MYEFPQSGIPVAEIVSALSFALDLTEDAVPGHALRTCLLGMRLAQAIGLGEADRASLFYALLLKDIGCSSNAARLCQIMGGDDRKLKAEFKLEDWTRNSWKTFLLVWRNLEPNSPLARRIRRMTELILQPPQHNREMITLRCDRGASIVAGIGLPQATAVAIRHLDEHWDGSGFPGMLTGENIPLLSRILLIAQHLDVFGTSRGPNAAILSLRERSGRWFDPDLVRSAHVLHRTGLLWSNLTGDDANTTARKAVIALEPGRKLLASSTQLDQICEAFASVVDIKSSFTGSHSRNVTAASLLMADTLGVSPQRRRFLSRAALLHDLGKLRVPNSILDKPGKLTDDEFAVIREHPTLTQQILTRVDCFAFLAIIAGQHHEKLDGSGYPNHLPADALSQDARLIAVADVYAALAEDRPYRAGLTLPEIRAIMDRDAGPKLDPTCYEALLAALEHAPELPIPPPPNPTTLRHPLNSAPQPPPSNLKPQISNLNTLNG